MRPVGIFLMFLFCPFAGAQSVVQQLTELTPAVSKEKVVGRVEQHVAFLKDKLESSTDDLKSIKIVFDETHKKFLRKYKMYTQFNELVETGKYDCLSATALFGVVLENLNYRYRIVETNYHIFLLVNVAGKEVLIETTDRLNGLVTDEYLIESRIDRYKQNQLVAATQNHYRYQAEIFNTLSSDQVIGLLMFNQAVSHYNNNQWLLCHEALKQAIALYENPRVEELAVILVHTVNQNQMDMREKQDIISTYTKYLTRVNPILASR